MFSADDTIVAIATPPGRGGIGVIRISGPGSSAIAAAILERRAPLAARRATCARIRVPVASAGVDHATDGPRDHVDAVIATYFPAPHSYTGEDVVEVSAHGSPVVLELIVRAAMSAGARLARPGEFTLRAFLNGKLDLVQAEAVGDLIAAATPLQARLAFDQLQGTLTERIAAIDAELFELITRLEASLDFPDEGYHFIEPGEIAGRVAGVRSQVEELLAVAARGRLIRDGATVVIGGRPNVGKSSLFNALCGSDRAIVTAVPGTTRDLVTERVDIDGILVTLVDTAGARTATDAIEREGVERGVRARAVADLVIVVLDESEPLTDTDRQLLDQTSGTPHLIVVNKIDARAADLEVAPCVRVSARTGEGIQSLRHSIATVLGAASDLHDSVALSNIRHVELLRQARDHLVRAHSAAGRPTPEEFLLIDLHEARARLEEIVGTRASDDVLRTIFERFCIGK